ncbi:MAG TPA: hypothetical protein VNU68_25760 [Verrucomicrobiae bacterium]|jgi:hypothetical protein|nr:hypothetical protein [Verrucomicrobiae bacterium]
MPVSTPTTFTPEALRVVPPFNWVPPEWGAQKPILEDYGELPDDLVPPTLNCIIPLAEPLETLRDLGKNYASVLTNVTAQRELETDLDQEEGTELKKLPHPGSDFSHEEGNEALTEGAAGRGNISGAEGANPKGMPRLKLVFEHALCKVTTYLGQLNAALDANDKEDYTAARNAYLELLRDLDDHEPQKQIPGESGYGRSLKWFYVTPYITGGKIQGASVEGKWNPHFSSSGIPIPH